MRKILDLLSKLAEQLIRSRHLLSILFLAAVLTRLLGVYLGGTRADDDGVYLRLAQNIVNGQGFVGDDYAGNIAYSWLPPGFAYLRALFLTFFSSDVIPLRVFFVLLSSLSQVLLFSIARRIFQIKAAVVAALIWILYPPQWFWSTRINPHTFSMDMTVICLFLTLKGWESRSLWFPIGAGLGWAVLSLMRGEFAFGIFPLCLGSLFAFRNYKVGLRYALVLMLGWTLGFSPWVIRNYRIHHKFILISTNYGDNIWFAYNPNYRFTGEAIPYPPELKNRLLSEPDELKRANILEEDALRYMKKNPGRVVCTVTGNFLNFWRPWLSPQVARWPENVVYVCAFVPIFFCFLLGLVQVPWRQPAWLVIGGLIAYKTAIHIPFYVIVRFRECIMPLIILVAVYPLQKLIEPNFLRDNVPQ